MKVIGFRDKEVESLVLDCRDILKGEELSFEPNKACKYLVSNYVFVMPIKLFVKVGEQPTIENAIKNLKDDEELDKTKFFEHLRDLIDIARTEKGFEYIEGQVKNICNSRDLFYPYGNSLSVYLVPNFQDEVCISAEVFNSSVQTIKIKKEKTPFLLNGKNRTVITIEDAGMEPVRTLGKYNYDREM
ncbi:MAG: hypothetical protein J5779_02275 [Clostridia bacterium]|nr:hypothetical protein [Clostridia bacterium]